MRLEEAPTLDDAYRMDLREGVPALTKEEAVRASLTVKCPPGKAVAVCHGAPARIGVVELPDEARETFRPDLATVIAVGEGVTLCPGDVVLTDNQLGKRVQGLELDGVQTDGEVRMYGCEGGTAFDADLYDNEVTGDAEVPFGLQDWSDGIPAKVVGCSVQAVGDKAVFRLPPLQAETSGGVLLTESRKRRSALWTVESVGERTTFLKPGHKVCLHTGGATYLVTENGVEFAIAPESAVYFWSER